MEASELLFKKIIKRSATWGELRKEIYRDFMYLPEEYRNVFADLWDKLSSSNEFHQRKMMKDKSNDPRLYDSVAVFVSEKQMEKDRRAILRNMRYINGKPVDFEEFKRNVDSLEL